MEMFFFNWDGMEVQRDLYGVLMLHAQGFVPAGIDNFTMPPGWRAVLVKNAIAGLQERHSTVERNYAGRPHGARLPFCGKSPIDSLPIEKKSPPCGARREGVLSAGNLVVVVGSLPFAAFFEVARGENLFLAGIRPRKPGGLVPVEVVDDIGIFGVGDVIFAGEDLRLHLHPASPQSLNLRALLAGSAVASALALSRGCRLGRMSVTP